VIGRKTNRRHMTGDHHSRTAGRATPLVRAVDAILGTHRPAVPGVPQNGDADDTASGAVLAAAAWVHTVSRTVNWQAILDASGARRVDLPTYAFQREHYWLYPPWLAAVSSVAALSRRRAGGDMLDETKRKAVVLDYFKRVNAGDVEAICELFSPEARIEDP